MAMMAIGACGSDASTAQNATLPAPSVQGIARVNVLCLIVDRTAARMALQDRLCAQVRAIAARGAPVPVATIGFGDPALLARDSLGVLVHASVDRSTPTPMLILSMRPYRADPGAGTFFGAAPVAVPMGPGGSAPDAAIAAALDQILPWRMTAAR